MASHGIAADATAAEVAGLDAAPSSSAAAPQSQPSDTVTFVLGPDETKRVECPRRVLVGSGLLHAATQGDPTAHVIPLPDIPVAAMKKLVEYMIAEHGSPAAFPLLQPADHPVGCPLSQRWTPQQEAFMSSCSTPLLLDVMLWSNYFDMPGLVQLTTAKLASLLAFRTPAEIKTTFELPGVTNRAPDQTLVLRFSQLMARMQVHPHAGFGAGVPPLQPNSNYGRADPHLHPPPKPRQPPAQTKTKLSGLLPSLPECMGLLRTDYFAKLASVVAAGAEEVEEVEDSDDSDDSNDSNDSVHAAPPTKRSDPSRVSIGDATRRRMRAAEEVEESEEVEEVDDDEDDDQKQHTLELDDDFTANVEVEQAEEEQFF